MKGDLPTKIKVDNVIYKVSKCHGLKDENGRAVYGLCHFDKQLIEIDIDTGDDFIRNTFEHELAHAIWYERGLHDKIDDEKLFEAIIEETAKARVQVCRDNADYVAFICKKEKKPRKKKEKVNAENPQLSDKNIV